jgi:hypothetical protein
MRRPRRCTDPQQEDKQKPSHATILQDFQWRCAPCRK